MRSLIKESEAYKESSESGPRDRCVACRKYANVVLLTYSCIQHTEKKQRRPNNIPSFMGKINKFNEHEPLVVTQKHFNYNTI